MIEKEGIILNDNIFEKLSYLSRLDKIDESLGNEFKNILHFVEKISTFNIHLNKDLDHQFNSNLNNISNCNINYNLKNIDSSSLREDNEYVFKEIKLLHSNFSNTEDDFCITPLLLDKEKKEDNDD